MEGTCLQECNVIAIITVIIIIADIPYLHKFTKMENYHAVPSRIPWRVHVYKNVM